MPGSVVEVDNPPRGGEGADLEVAEARGFLGRQPRLVRQRVMHQGEHGEVRARLQGLGKGADRQSVSHDHSSIPGGVQGGLEALPGAVVGLGKGPLEFVDPDPPAQPPESVHHPGVVQIPPGALVERTRHQEVEVDGGLLRHTAPS